MLAAPLLVSPSISEAQSPPHREVDDVAVLAGLADARSTDVQAATFAWQSSGVLVQAGDSYLVHASGRWSIGPLCAPTGPDGIGPYTLACWDLGGQIVAGATHSTLVARVGHAGQPFVVGGSREFTAESAGVLYFMVNDHPSFFGDNSGSVKATVRLLSAPAAGAAPAPAGQVTRGVGGGGRAPQ